MSNRFEKVSMHPVMAERMTEVVYYFYIMYTLLQRASARFRDQEKYICFATNSPQSAGSYSDVAAIVQCNIPLYLVYSDVVW